MHSALFIYVLISTLLHEGTSIGDGSLPRIGELAKNGNSASVGEKDHLGITRVGRFVPDTAYTHDGQEINRMGEDIEDGQSILNGLDPDLKIMTDAHARLFSITESEARQALKTIESQLNYQVMIDRNWRDGKSIAVRNLKALEALLMRLDATESVNGLDLTQRGVLEKTLEIVYDLAHFSGLPDNERVWFDRQIEDFLKRSDSLFLTHEYLQIVRRRMANMPPIVLDRGAVKKIDPTWRIGEAEVMGRNTPQDILDFKRIFNERTEEKDILELGRIVEGWTAALEASSSIHQPARVNFLRLELIGVAALAFGRNRPAHLSRQLHPGFFSSLIRLSKTAWDPANRILAENLVRWFQALQPTFTDQFVKEYPLVLEEAFERQAGTSNKVELGGFGSLLDVILRNGAEKGLRQTALEFKAIFERMQAIHLAQAKVSIRNKNLKPNQNFLPPLELIKNSRMPQAFQTADERWVTRIPASRLQSDPVIVLKMTATQVIEQNVRNYWQFTQYLQSQYLSNPSAIGTSRLTAAELVFGTGLFASRLIKLKFPNPAYQSLTINSLAALKHVGRDKISSAVENTQFNVLAGLATKYSTRIEENTSKLIAKLKGT